ncbi:uncharacterized protein LOC117182126 [Belonocnema kinseyi]|uniref:uncharacterized protein LOC117182126 n=1 Tax=Belonocnema kinseyi TaxID=2817044 RepID=UPI00143CDBC5|nr:uncharacterized protein LOC117182126 [Belonocnema kinseyi]
MKNVIPNLLLAIEFFVQVCELNSSPINYGEGSSRPPPYRPHKDENTIVIDYMGMDIYVTRKSFGNIHVPVRCIFPEIEGYPKLHGIPDVNTKQNFNFTTMPLYSIIDGVRYCVVYVKEDGELLGVKAPPTDQISEPGRYKGDPKTLSPDKYKYYLTYLAWDFVVYHKEGDAFSLTDVKLYPKNKPNDEYKSIRAINTYHIRALKIECAGISFFASRRYKRNQTSPLVLDNSHVMFEAAWLHPESIPPLLQQVMTKEQRLEWFPPQITERRKLERQFGHPDVPTHSIGESSMGKSLKKAKKNASSSREKKV